MTPRSSVRTRTNGVVKIFRLGEEPRDDLYALAGFGAPLENLEISPTDSVRPGAVIQPGPPPNRIDILTGMRGVDDFGSAREKRIAHALGGRLIPFRGRAALVANKRATGRLRDLADMEALGGKP